MPRLPDGFTRKPSARRLVPTLVGLALLGAVRPAPAQFHGAWLPPQGSFEAKIGIGYTDNDRWFCGSNLGYCEPGDRALLAFNAQNQYSRIFTPSLQVEIALLDWLAVSGFLPVHAIRFKEEYTDTTSLELESDGVGDLSLAVRAGKALGLWGVSGGYGIEFPTGKFTTNSFNIPVGRGTRNHNLFAELGRSLHPLPAYLEAGVLWMIREAYVDPDFGTRIDWGDEIHGRVGGGWRVRHPWWLKAEVRAMKSGDREDLPPGLPDEFRSLLEIVPGAMFQWAEDGWAEVWASIPLAGRNTLSDPTFGFAVSRRFGVFSRPDRENPAR